MPKPNAARLSLWWHTRPKAGRVCPASPAGYNRRYLALGLGLVLAACAAPQPTLTPAAPPANTLPPPALATATLTPAPSPTPEPLAARVNGQTISLAVYQAELARCEQGRTQAQADPATCPAAVLDLLINQALLTQAAQTAGLTVSTADLEQALAALGDTLPAWWATAGYTPETGRAALADELLRTRWLDQWTRAQVGEAAEQIRARALTLPDEAEARTTLARLAGGADFAALAREVSLDSGSRLSGGDLGWLVRGALTQPAVEASLWKLAPGQTSEPIATEAGWVVVQVLERDPARLLTPAQRDVLRQRALAQWLAQARAQATLEILLAP